MLLVALRAQSPSAAPAIFRRFRLEILKSCDVSARAAEVGNKATFDRIGCANENDRDGLGRFLHYHNSRFAPGNNYIRSVRNQLFGPRANAFGISACETVITMNVTIFDPAKLLKPLPER
jgi:hypothetical protein